MLFFQYKIAAPANDDDCEEEDEEDEDFQSRKKDDFDSDDPVEREYLVSDSLTVHCVSLGDSYCRIVFVTVNQSFPSSVWKGRCGSGVRWGVGGGCC